MGDETRTKPRDLPLDLLRGLAVAGMVLVVSPGDWVYRFHQLDHAAWFGLTLADLVFPAFLFSVGMAIGLSFPRPLGPAERQAAWRRVARRVALLILLGLALNLLAADLAHLRLPGVLQRIALCYGLAMALCLMTARPTAGQYALDWRVIAGAAAALLLLYTALLALVPVPGFGAGRLDPEGNLGAWIDRALFTAPHLWPLGTAPDGRVVFDPEGLLSTLPAAVDTLAGILAALWLRRRGTLLPVLLAGGVLVIAGLALDPLVPINKKIWTASFALLSSGAAAIAYVGCVALLRIPALRPATAPLRVLGGNAIAAFVLSQCLSAFGGLALPDGAGGTITPQHWGFVQAQRLIANPYLASLACALAILALIVLALVPLHRRGVHLRL
jgi:predicted acyltransferase